MIDNPEAALTAIRQSAASIFQSSNPQMFNNLTPSIMGNLQLTVEEINQLKPLEIVEHPVVRERFIFIYDKLLGQR